MRNISNSLITRFGPKNSEPVLFYIIGLAFKATILLKDLIDPMDILLVVIPHDENNIPNIP